MRNIAIFDTETDGFLDQVTKIHCLVIEDYDTGAIFTYRSDDKVNTILKGLEFLKSFKIIVAHNGIDYDIPVIKKLYPNYKFENIIQDTLVYSRVIWSDIKSTDFALHRKGILNAKDIGRHSLEAWGQRLKLLKGDYGKTADWSKIDDDMVKYCELDVKVTSKLYNCIQRQEVKQDVLDMEQQIHSICLEQTKMGFPFNVKKAQKLLGKLMSRKAELYAEIFKELGSGWLVNLGEKVSTRTVKYKDVLRGNESAGSHWTKVKFVEFNPNSRAHLAKRLVEKYNWKPTEFSEDGTPNIDDEILSKMKFPIAPKISEFLMIQKRLGQLAEGRQAWLSVEKEGKIHGRVNTMGAITARCTHSDPNLAQIPSNSAPYGAECRELFEAPRGWKQLGTDASGLELRMLAHYMAKYDDGAYGEIILNGDIHTANQLAAGLPTRNNAKTFIYGFLFGAGAEKIGSIINGNKQRGQQLIDQFLKNIPALKSLREAVSNAVESKGKLKALDGRFIPVRHKHAALNTLLQSAGAIVCKMWVIRVHEILKENGFTHGVEYKQAAYIHDEIQLHYDPNKIDGDKLGQISDQAIKDVGTKLGIRIPLATDYKIGNNYAECH